MFKKFKTFIKENKKIDEFFYKKQIIFFFKYENELFGSKEEDRIVFAKMKNKKKNFLEYEKENFSAFFLKKLLKGVEEKKFFSKKELKKIKVLQIEDIKKELNE
jgi:hypothetical protein